MKSSLRFMRSSLAGGALLLLIAIFGCTENLIDPEPPQFAKPGSIDVVDVNAVEPDSTFQDTTLTVAVLGDGFDDGSTVEFMVEGVVNDKLRVKKVKYINKKKLEVELEVDPLAEVRLYDVRVSAKRGPRGVGTELMRVMERVRKPPPQSITVTDFSITQVSPTESPGL